MILTKIISIYIYRSVQSEVIKNYNKLKFIIRFFDSEKSLMIVSLLVLDKEATTGNSTSSN